MEIIFILTSIYIYNADLQSLFRSDADILLFVNILSNYKNKNKFFTKLYK